MLLAPPVAFGYTVATDDTPSTPFGATITASGTANTKGAWASVLATITYDLFYLWVETHDAFTAAASEQVMVDLGIGPDASNVTSIFDNLLSGSSPPITLGTRSSFFPLFVPAGTQLWARCQSNIVSNTVAVNVRAWGGPDRPAAFPVIHKWESEGENLATTLGATITPGATGAQGAYAEIVASSAFDYSALMMARACADTTMGALGYSGGIGIGAATEQNLGTCYSAYHTATEQILDESFAVFCDVPAGTRLAARMSCSAATDATVSGIIYGGRS